MEFYRIWRILVGNKWLLIGLPIIAAAFGLGFSYVLPDQYESTALVLVRPHEDIRFDAGASDRKELVGFPVNDAAPLDTPSKTYIEVIKSPAVAQRIVAALHLDVAKPNHFTSVFEKVKDAVKTWIGESVRSLRDYIRFGRTIPTTPFDRAVEGVEDNLIVAVRKDTYAFDIAFRAADPQQAAAVANMAAQIFIEHNADAYRSEATRAREFIEKQLDSSREALAKARAATLAFKTSGHTFDLATEYSDALKNLSDLENTLAKDRGTLAALGRGYSPTSPEVSAQEAEQATLSEQIADLRAQLLTYPEKQRQIDALTLTERLASESYEFFLKRYEEARVRESSVINEIRIVSPAMPPLYPAKPVKALFAGMSFAVALVLAMGWALFSEYLDPRVRTFADLDDMLGVPLLGAIPTLRRSSWTLEAGVREPQR
jgi:uncharacterized protein involved in exopolysaccharide biosynthesis